MTETNKIVGPLDTGMPAFNVAGLMLPVVADCPEGGFLQIVSGDNPLGQAVPGIQIPKGGMLMLVVPEQATQLRPHLRQMEKAMMQGLKPN